MAQSPTSLLLMGYNETGRLGEGWHDLERDGRTGTAYRATQAKADLTLPVPKGTHTLFMLYSGSPTLAGKTLSGRLELVLGEQNATGDTRDEAGKNAKDASESGPGAEGKEQKYSAPLGLEHDTWTLCTMALDSEADGSGRLQIHADILVVPDRVLHNGDARALGFYVSAVWIR